MAGAQAQQAPAAGPFSDAQADADQTDYAQNCASCHGNSLAGSGEAPALTGSGFIGSWRRRTTDELYNRIRASMPPDNPNSLGADTYAAITAFLLKANGAQPGTSPLTPATAVTIGSVANGQMPAGLITPGRGGRGGRGAGGRGGNAPARRRGLTVAGTAKNYTPITDDMMLHPPDGDWLMHYANYAGWSNSPLKQITPKNVGTLQLRWAWPLEDGARQQITPLVHDGVMFLSTNMTNTVQALDARTGDLIWENRVGPVGARGKTLREQWRSMGTCSFIPRPMPNSTPSMLAPARSFGRPSFPKIQTTSSAD
jgi:alcohol dehydrogenase (cytochrome c)